MMFNSLILAIVIFTDRHMNWKICSSISLRNVFSRFGGKMAEEQDVEITFLPINTSEIHLHVELLL